MNNTYPTKPPREAVDIGRPPPCGELQTTVSPCFLASGAEEGSGDKRGDRLRGVALCLAFSSIILIGPQDGADRSPGNKTRNRVVGAFHHNGLTY